MINTIKMIIKEFACKDFKTINTSKDKIILKSQQAPVKSCKEGFTEKPTMVTIGRDAITLRSLQISNVYHDRTCIKDKKVIIIRNDEVILKTEKTILNEYKEIDLEEIDKTTVHDNKFIYESRKHEYDQHGLNTEEVNVSKACKNERFILLNIIMMTLHKYVKKHAKEKKQLAILRGNTYSKNNKSYIIFEWQYILKCVRRLWREYLQQKRQK